MDKRKEYWDNYYSKNKELMKLKSSIQYSQQIIKNPNYSRDYYRKNKEKLKQYHKEYQKKMYDKKKKKNTIPLKIVNKVVILSFD